MGLSQGYSAILIPKLLETNFADQSQASWIASLGVVSNPLGALVAGICAECFGRRSAITLATLPHAVGWLLIALSRNVPMLYTGRFVSGIGTGMANGLYLYVSEVRPPLRLRILYLSIETLSAGKILKVKVFDFFLFFVF